MTTAPKDGTLVRLRLREDGRQFVGYYSDRWWGWIEHGDPCPVIRGDIRFAGWEPIDGADYRSRKLLERVQQDRTGPAEDGGSAAGGGQTWPSDRQPHRDGTQAEAEEMRHRIEAPFTRLPPSR
jgi:hypothetical protein